MNKDSLKGTETLSEIQKKILDVITSNLIETEFETQKIHVNTPLTDLNINSITFVKTIVALESAFDFEFDDEKLLFSAFPTIGSMIQYVETKVL